MSHATRREFLKTALAGLAMGSSMVSAQETGDGDIPSRPLGKTGVRVPIVGLGGWHIGAVKEEAEAIEIMHEAIEGGMTFFDNCWDYHDGKSEEWMGRALDSSSRRDRVFLMTKVCGRDAKTARTHLEDSLRRLRTDRLDLWQFHGMKWEDDAELIFGEGGALETALEAKRAGKVRFIGFTGHKDPDFHLPMLERDFAWDTVQMPLNVLDAHYRSFQHLVMPKCVEREIGVIAMKGLGSQNGRIVRDTGLSAEVCRRYVLSLPVSTHVCGITSRENLRQDLSIARTFTPMPASDIDALLLKTETPSTDGKIEAYKTGNYGCDWHHRKT